MAKGIIFLVGAGPGDPGLITVKALDCIRTADTVVYDFLANPCFLREARPDAELICVGKRGGCHTLRQHEINQLLVELGQAGKRVCRLKGGDPFVFGRGGEEALELAEAGIPFEIVPGVTAGVAAPAYAGIPVTQRGLTSSLAFITGHEDPTKDESDIDWSKVATGIGTLVFYMGVKRMPDNIEQLLKHGLPADTPAALIESGTLPGQKTVVGTLETIVELGKSIRPPAIFMVGKVAQLREKLAWFETRALSGRTIVVTRSRTQASDLTRRLTELGASVLEMPTIQIQPPDSYAPLDEAIGRIETYQWVLFTSVNGVDAFFERLKAAGKDARSLPNVASIGPATTDRLAENGILADAQPAKYTGAALVDALADKGMDGARVLLPRAAEAPPTVTDGLAQLGAEVDEVPAYQTVLVEEADTEAVEALLAGNVDAVTFTSSSTVRGFVQALGSDRVTALPASLKFVAIGPVTADTAREEGLELAAEAEEHTIPGLVEVLVGVLGS